MSPAKHCERRRSGSENRHSLDFWSRLADQPSHRFRVRGALGGNDDCCEPAKWRHCCVTASLGLGRIEARSVAADEGGNDLGLRIMCLDKDPSRLAAPSGTTRDLLNLLKAALGGTQVPA